VAPPRTYRQSNRWYLMPVSVIYTIVWSLSDVGVGVGQQGQMGVAVPVTVGAQVAVSVAVRLLVAVGVAVGAGGGTLSSSGKSTKNGTMARGPSLPELS